MSSGIYLVGRGKVDEGRIADATATLNGVIANVRESNPGVLLYEHAIDPKTGNWTGIEKYTDSEAIKAHLTDPSIGEALGRFMADLTPEGIVVMGDVSNEVKEMMAPFHPTFLGSSLGFSRSGGRKVVGSAS